MSKKNTNGAAVATRRNAAVEATAPTKTALVLTPEEQAFADKLTIERGMKIVNKSISNDLRVEKFVKGEFTIPKRFADRATLEKDLFNIEGGRGLGNVRTSAVALTVFTQPRVEQQVTAKMAEFAKMMLNPEQQAAIALKMPAYRAHLERVINAETVALLKRTYGVE